MNTTTMLIIGVLVIVLLIALVLKGKSNQKTTKVSATNKKNTKRANEATRLAVIEDNVPKKPLVDETGVINRVDNLLGQKQYAKAEALLNSTLKQDSTLASLYSKLLELYELQDDQFAIKQLFETVQRLELHHVYQQLTIQHDQYKAQDSSVHSTPEPTPVDRTPTKPPIAQSIAPAASISFEDLAPKTDVTRVKSSTETHLSFDDLMAQPSKPVVEPSTGHQNNPLGSAADFNRTVSPTVDHQAGEVVAHTPTLDFDSTNQVSIKSPDAHLTADPQIKPAPQTELNFDSKPVQPDAHTLTFDLASPPATDTKQPLDSKSIPLDESKPASLSMDEGLTFSLDPSPQHDILPKIQPEVGDQTLVFSLTPSDDKGTSTPSILPSSSVSDIDVTLVPKPSDVPAQDNNAVAYQPQAQTQSSAAPIATDLNDPLVKQFPELAHVDDIMLNIDLAEQYIRLGEFEAAQRLLDEHTIPASSAERVHVLLDQIQQKITQPVRQIA